MENNLVDKVFIVNEFGKLFTQDDFNNLLIDMYVAERDYKKQLEENKGKPISAIAGGKTVTITISKKDHYNPSD